MNKSPCQQNVNKKCQNTKLNGGEHPVVAYSVETNEFGIINEYGGISTYFKPQNGMAYWLEQIPKYAPKKN